MPLYNYKCPECGHLMEKFQHNIAEEKAVECDECQHPECERQVAFAHNRVWLEAKDLYKEKIGPDAKRIMDNMKKGSSKEFLDIYGDK